MTIAQKHNRNRGKAVQTLLNAAAYLQDRNFPVDFNKNRAIRILLDASVRVVAMHVYMRYGLRVDRDRETGHLALFSESNYHTTRNDCGTRCGRTL